MSTHHPAPQNSTTNGTTAIKLEDQQPTLNEEFQSIDWDSERQLISSLAKLQELESKVRHLPSRVLDNYD
jgi:hypothetical protein